MPAVDHAPVELRRSMPNAAATGYPTLRLVDRSVMDRRAMFRRRRILAVALLGCALLGARTIGTGVVGALTGSASSIVPDEPVPATGSVVTVEAGQTYWSIAESLRPTGDIRATVDALVASNGGRPLQVGDRLVVAVGDRRGD
ncbi:MAG: hypothetical protein HYR89_00990 [Actinobacteria bacterium]|nr:hypothetical protein [Actinomycetota bacterium]